MEVVFTDHARSRMAVRHITPDMVTQTLEQPDTHRVGYRGRTVAMKAFTQGTVKVVYAIEHQRHVVITVMWQYPAEG